MSGKKYKEDLHTLKYTNYIICCSVWKETSHRPAMKWIWWNSGIILMVCGCTTKVTLIYGVVKSSF